MIKFKHLGDSSPRILVFEIAMFAPKKYVEKDEEGKEVARVYCVDITLKGGTFKSIECENEAHQKGVIKKLDEIIGLNVISSYNI